MTSYYWISFYIETINSVLPVESSAMSSPVPWIVGLLIGIVTGATIIITVWVGQVLLCRKRRTYSANHETIELSKKTE